MLGDILNQPYTIDPNVGGQVTIRTTAGIPRDALPATLETLLRMNGATMVNEGNLWKVVPQTAAVRGNVTPQLGNSTRALPQGYSGADRAAEVTSACARCCGSSSRSRRMRRRSASTTCAICWSCPGPSVELRHLLETIDMFDIDWMSGMSAGVFTLQNADVKSVSQELDKVIGDRDTSPFTGILRIIPIERMNALLVISPNQAYIEQAKKWIERLDSGSGEGTALLRLQPAEPARRARRAAAAAGVHRPHDADAAPPGRRRSRPARPRAQIVSPPSFQTQPTIVPNTPQASAVPAAAAAAGAAVGAAAGARSVGGDDGVGVVRNIQVVADKDQNTVLIVATPSEYSIIEQALKKLDVAVAAGDDRGDHRRS